MSVNGVTDGVSSNYSGYTNYSQPKMKTENNANATADSLVDNGISVEISKRGLALAEEMTPFIDTYETTRTLLNGVGHIGSEKMINGTFTDVLAENYQNELQRINENYSGKEYEKQLAILDKAYEEASSNIAIGYVKQLKILTGDIVIKPQTGTFYASESEAEKVYQENLEKDDTKKLVIDSELSDIIKNDTKNILLQLKNPVLNQQDKKNDIWGQFMSYADIRQLGSYLNNGTYRNTDDISDFSKSILERYSSSIS